MRVNVFGVRSLIERDRGHVGIEVEAIGIRIVIVAAEDPARQERVADHAQSAQRISPAGADPIVFLEPAPLLFRVVAVDVDCDVVQIIPIEIGPQLGQRVERDLVVVDFFVQPDDSCRQPHDTRDAIQGLVRLAKFDRWTGQFVGRIGRRVGLKVPILIRRRRRRSRGPSAGKRGPANRHFVGRSSRTLSGRKEKTGFPYHFAVRPSTAIYHRGDRGHFSISPVGVSSGGDCPANGH